MKSIMLRLRIEPEFKEMLQKAVKEGKAESMSQLVREAVSYLLVMEKMKNEKMPES
jgi:Arc/MetJ-type ribon-helix-helix transcriptional regulator